MRRRNRRFARARQTRDEVEVEYCLMTQAEVAKALGVTRARVSQIELVALAKLRAAFGGDPR